MEKARVWVDFNYVFEHRFVLVSFHDDYIRDSEGHKILLYDGLVLDLYMEDLSEDGSKEDNIVAKGTVLRNYTRKKGGIQAFKWMAELHGGSVMNESELNSKN